MKNYLMGFKYKCLVNLTFFTLFLSELRSVSDSE